MEGVPWVEWAPISMLVAGVAPNLTLEAFG